MADIGKLRLGIIRAGTAVRRVQIDSTRPQAFRLLQGRTPEHAVQMASMLYAICGRAQGVAAVAAVAGAQGRTVPDMAALDRHVACEATQEHLWRLLLDWPRLLGLPQAQADFARWHGMLRDIAAGHGAMPDLQSEIEARWLGIPAAEWCALAGWGDLQRWWRACGSPAACLLAALDASDAALVPAALPPLLPPWTAVQALETCDAGLDAEFCAQPHWHGSPAETGALAWHAAAPLLRDVLRQRPSRMLARVLARAYDVLQIAQGRLYRRLDYAAARDGAGLAVVQTARGLLMHHVRIAADRVQDYWVTAPTEWNFHPRGALALGLAGLDAADAGRLASLAAMQALSLDPCVAYEIEVSDA